MTRLLILIAIAVAGAAGLRLALRPDRDPDPPARILCGGSMRLPVERLCRPLEGRALLDFAGSETLLPRVLAGGPGDILVTHDPFPNQVRAAGRLAAVAEVGDLAPVLAVRRDRPVPDASLAALAGDGLRLGLPDARYSTCGAYLADRLAAEGLSARVAARTVVVRRSHQELAHDLRLGAVDMAVVWNFVAAQNRDELATVPLPG
ncbi:MAG: hypothetical protein RLZZ127_2859, partial [Planctomycetota bacterium]